MPRLTMEVRQKVSNPIDYEDIEKAIKLFGVKDKYELVVKLEDLKRKDLIDTLDLSKGGYEITEVEIDIDD